MEDSTFISILGVGTIKTIVKVLKLVKSVEKKSLFLFVYKSLMLYRYIHSKLQISNIKNEFCSSLGKIYNLRYNERKMELFF
jgi:hypothetical protein